MSCSEPQMYGYYSINTNRIYEKSASSLKYFKLPKVPLNLNEGLEDIKVKPDSYFEEKMDSILMFITNNKTDLINKNCDGDRDAKGALLIPSTQYITYRGVIRMIMCSPYEKRYGWTIIAAKYKGNIYLCQYTKPEKRIAEKNEPDWKKKLSYYGPKFEQFCLTDDPSKMPDTSEQVDECSQFFCVFKRMLAGRRFFFAAEMDGVISEKPLDLKNPKTYKDLRFVELKVTNNPYIPKHKSSANLFQFEKIKCQNVWTQSYLTGVNDVYFGFRDSNGMVHQIAQYDMSKLHRNWVKHWRNPAACFEFLSNFLQLVENKLANIDCPDTVYEFNYDEQTGNISDKLHSGRTHFSILPTWYLASVNA